MPSDLIHGAPPSDADLHWLKLMQAAREQSLAALDEGAKQLIGLDGLISGIYFGAVTFAQLPASVLSDANRVLFLAPVVLWLASLVAAILTLIPRAYRYNPQSPDEARAAYQRIVQTKDRRLQVALGFFAASLVALVVVLWVYLGMIASGQIPPPKP